MTPDPLRIRDLVIDMPAVQAALSGYSDQPMRRVARAHGAPYALAEVVLDELVLIKGKQQRRVLELRDDDHPIGGQLMGSVPETFGDAARAMVAAGYDVVDINFGCPVSKVLGRCRGGYLLQEPPKALDIVDRVLDAVAGAVPVTVKMRRGFDDDSGSESAFWEILEGAFTRGIAAVTVHGRTVRQKYVGPSRWEFVRRVKQHCGEHTVFGSGDLFGPYDAVRMLRETGVDGVTMARGCIGNPFVFRQIRGLLGGGTPLRPTVDEQRAALELHWDTAREHYDLPRAVATTRRHAIKYAQYHPEPTAAREALVAVRSSPALERALDSVFDATRWGAVPPGPVRPEDAIVPVRSQAG
jgi:nifR3 family TIM-barrel protein